MMAWGAFEHAAALRQDGNRWYVAQENARGDHRQPEYGEMSESAARREAARRNAGARTCRCAEESDGERYCYIHGRDV